MIFNIILNQYISPKEAVLIFIVCLLSFLLSLSFHEFAHAFVAVKLGDDTPKAYGRYTLNPFKHLDMFGFLSFLILGVGWAKPVPINPNKFKKYRTGIKLVSSAGIIVNFILGLISALLFLLFNSTIGASNTFMEYLLTFLDYSMLINSYFILFNIIPLPPLDGFNFISSFCKPNNKFVAFCYRNAVRILWTIILVSILVDLLFDIDIFGMYLSLIYNYIFNPLSRLGS